MSFSAILTRHQETTSAVDQFGRRLEIPLLKGRYKERPNNPRRPDGNIHQYCPPVHVNSEMSNLLEWVSTYSEEDPVIVASWLHHRFTQIHPYQDGNGRVARALTTMVLLRSDLLPLVIDRDLRVEYIGALESADLGELKPLATIFARVERNAILQALSVDLDTPDAPQATLTAAVINSLADKLAKRKEEKLAELREVNDIARVLRDQARSLLAVSFEDLALTVNDVGAPNSLSSPADRIAAVDIGISSRSRAQPTTRESSRISRRIIISSRHPFAPGESGWSSSLRFITWAVN